MRPRPSMLTGRVSMRTTCSWSRLSSAVSSIVTMRSVSGIASASTPSSVDLPAPVPPEIRMFLRARTAMTRNSRISGESVPEIQQIVAPQPPPAEAADRERRTVDRHRRKRRVHAAAVRQPEIGHRRRRVDAAADARGDALDDAHDVLGVTEADVGAFEAAEPLDVHLVGRVDQDVADRRIGEQRRQRTHADRLVGQLLGQPHALGFVEPHVLRGNRTRRKILHGGRDVGAVVLEQSALADLVEQPLLQRGLDGQVVGAPGLGDFRRGVRCPRSAAGPIARRRSSAARRHRPDSRESRRRSMALAWNARSSRRSLTTSPFDRRPSSDADPRAPAAQRYPWLRQPPSRRRDPRRGG